MILSGLTAYFPPRSNLGRNVTAIVVTYNASLFVVNCCKKEKKCFCLSGLGIIMCSGFADQFTLLFNPMNTFFVNKKKKDLVSVVRESKYE